MGLTYDITRGALIPQDLNITKRGLIKKSLSPKKEKLKISAHDQHPILKLT